MVQVINKVPWNELKRILNKDCSYIPSTLLNLVSTDKKERNNAYWKYDNNVVVQGGLFESAFYVVPFLIELLKCENTIEKDALYNLLFEIGNGRADLMQTVTYKVISEPFQYYIPYEDGITLPLEIACKNAVLNGFSLYVKELKDKTSRFRKDALQLLGMLLLENKYLFKCLLKEFILNETNKDFLNLLNEYYNEFNELLKKENKLYYDINSK